MDQSHQHFDALLAGYVAGTLAEPARLLVRSHLDLSPVNRAFVRDLEATGGRMLEDVAPMPLTDRDKMLEAIFASPEEERISVTPKPAAKTRLPATLVDFIGKDFDELPWKTKLPGLREYRIGEIDGCNASLLWIRAGQAMPTHTHHGTELTLVLEGGFSDSSGHFVRGDVAYADDDVDHRPIADEGEDCLCFAVTEGSLRLTGPVGRFFAPFLRG
ncbi:MAG: transcriptional regulator [Rhodobacteraceae bacterium]|uniref:ChrR family anti-sigma-E factor n=1 Tax=Stappia TaxID=152161 RepID=UPI000C643C51|nr:ChrR family anti-sigma-E factor [Stappia stellulata]MBB99375.1 transcriptional regulator [Paracoccaceae bacterium]MCA1241232.1 ChrR family anti-sigma-E factor [Stappia stellulata]